ncbi:MAG: TRAP transporter small permease [Burkholderiales bacterium]|nr:TRAP transporter small permease [Burkholderiales bacterium]
MASARGPAADEGPALHALATVVGALTTLAMALAAAALLVSLALIGWAVVMRYLFNAAPVWVDEVVGFALIAIVMLAAAQTLRRGEHIAVDLLTSRMPPRWRRWTQAWGALAAIAVAAILVVNGWETAALARTLGLLTEGHLEWPTWGLMLLMPAGGVLLALAGLEALWRALAGLPPRHDDGAHGAGDGGDRG